MKKRFLMLSFVALLTLPFMGSAIAAQYHPAQSAAEQALDHAFHLEISANTAHLAGLFTPQLRNAIANADGERARENCGEDRTKGACGLNYDVLLCAQNTPDVFLYRTISDSGEKAIVAYAWPGSGADTGMYRLIKVGDKWEVDGIDCSGKGADKFNMQ